MIINLNFSDKDMIFILIIILHGLDIKGNFAMTSSHFRSNNLIFILGVPGGEDYKNSLSYDDDDNCSIDDGCSLYTTDSLMTNTLSSYNKELHGE